MKINFKKIMAYVLTLAVISTIVLDFSAVDVQAAKKYVKSLSVSKSVTVNAGKTKTIKAKVKAVKKASTKIKARSSKKSIASVKVSGKKIKITGKKPGKAVITVQTAAKGKKGKVLKKKIKVTVKGEQKPPAPVPTPVPVPKASSGPAPSVPAAQTITLNKTNVTIVRSQGLQLTAVAVPAGTVQWSSSNPSVAAVNASGYVTGIAAGTAEIKAAIGSVSAVCQVIVAEMKYNVKSISAINTDEGTISVTFAETADPSILAGTTICVSKGDLRATAVFKKLSDDGKSAVYEFSKEELSKIQSGNYKIESDNMNIDEENATTSARVDIKGSSVKGLVYYKDFAGDVFRIKDASITINGESVQSNEKGFYQKGVPGDKYNAVVKAKGFFDETKEGIIVSANKASAYNFSMEPYDVEKVYLYGTVSKEGDSTTVISGAKVSLYEIQDGKETLKSVVNTDSNGKFVFANSDADFTKFEVEAGSYRRFTYALGMNKKSQYRVEIHKDLSSSNLMDVYEPYVSKSFELGSARGINVGTAMKKVEPLSEMTMQLTWDGDLSSKGDVEISLLATDGKTLLNKKKLEIEDSYFKDEKARKEMKSGAFKLIEKEFFDASTNKKPTLPKGTYYLVVKTLDEKGTVIDSIVVCPVEVVPGQRADAKPGKVLASMQKSIIYSVELSNEFGQTALANQGEQLNTVVDNKGTLSTAPVTFSSNIYEVVDGVNVLINSTPANSLEKSNDVFTHSYLQDNLGKDKEYYVETKKSHIINGDRKFSTQDTKVVNVEFKAAANVTNIKFKDAQCFIDKLNTDNDNNASTSERIHVNAIKINVKPADKNEAPVTRTIPVDKEYTVSQLVQNGVAVDHVEAKGLPVGEYTVEFDFANFKLDSEYSEDRGESVIDFQNAALECDARYEKVYPTTLSGVVAYSDTSRKMPANGVAVLYTSDFKEIVAAADFEESDGQTVYSLEDGVDGNFEGGSYKLLLRGEGIDYTVKDVTIAANEVKKNIDFRDLEVGGSTSMKPMIKTNTGTGLDASAQAVAYDKYYIDPWSDAVDYYAYRCLLGSDFDGSFELERVSGSDKSWIRENMSKGDYKLIVDSDITDLAAFEITLRNTYEDELTVNFTTYDNLVRINLVLSNKGEGGAAFTKGQLDYVTAESDDGTVSYDGYIFRSKVEDDASYFYVPKGKAYKITVYSDKNYVVSESKIAQYNESENIYLVCQAAKQ